jgi:NAD(P)-dependent dehydrogenase (short-subunit alcohol dehydrogenase family)
MTALGHFSEEMFGNLFHHINIKRRPSIDYNIKNQSSDVSIPSPLPLAGKILIVTGSNRGIGKDVVRDCASLGAEKIIMAVRDVEKGQQARQEIIDSLGLPVDIVVKKVDLENFESVREFANDIIQNEARIDILVNNAGILTGADALQYSNGMERMMRVNFFGSVLLTLLLFSKIKDTSSDAKIVFVASAAHWAVERLDVDDLHWKNKPFGSNMTVYGNSKLALVTFLRFFAPKAYVHGVRIYAVDPGVAPTDIARDSGIFHRFFIYGRMMRPFLRTTKEAADSVTKSVVANDKHFYNPTIFYFCDGKSKSPSKAVLGDEEAAKKLWSVVRESLDMASVMDSL